MSINFERAATIIGNDLKSLGYTWRLDQGHNHPRLYVGANGKERFTVLSRSANYDEGDQLARKRQDIQRDVLPQLPKPTPPPARSGGGESPKINGPTPEVEVDHRVWPLKVYVMGKGQLVVQMPRDALPRVTKADLDAHAAAGDLAKLDKMSHASLFLTVGTPTSLREAGRLGVIFTPDGVSPSKVRNSDQVAYIFPRAKVPFDYTTQSLGRGGAIKMCARRRGESLVCDKVIPKELLEDRPKQVAHKTHSLEDGGELREMMNEWLNWAEEQGHEPRVAVEDNRVAVSITERRERKL